LNQGGERRIAVPDPENHVNPVCWFSGFDSGSSLP
jgi:hypothetical protein